MDIFAVFHSECTGYTVLTSKHLFSGTATPLPTMSGITELGTNCLPFFLAIVDSLIVSLCSMETRSTKCHKFALIYVLFMISLPPFKDNGP